MKSLLIYITILSALFSMSSCAPESLDYNNPDVNLFVKQLKEGNYKTKNEIGVVALPNFTIKDIPMLLEHADDLSVIPTFPMDYNVKNGKIRLGESLLWIVESLRIGMPASMGCKMVEVNAPNYEALYFLSDQEVHEAVALYRSWWENRNYPRTFWTIDPCFNEPLCGSKFRWW